MTLHGHFDGKVIVLDEPPPPDWLPNLRVQIVPTSEDGSELKPAPKEMPVSDAKDEDDSEEGPSTALLRIASRASDLGLPADFSEEHDHYIHGTPKRRQ